MAKPVTHAELHDGFFVPGVSVGGNFTKSLPPTNKTLKDFKMFLEDSGALTVSWTEANYTKELTIGAANVKFAMSPPQPLAKTNSDKK